MSKSNKISIKIQSLTWFALFVFHIVGVGVILVTVSGAAWRMTAPGSTQCLGIGKIQDLQSEQNISGSWKFCSMHKKQSFNMLLLLFLNFVLFCLFSRSIDVHLRHGLGRIGTMWPTAVQWWTSARFSLSWISASTATTILPGEHARISTQVRIKRY